DEGPRSRSRRTLACLPVPVGRVAGEAAPQTAAPGQARLGAAPGGEAQNPRTGAGVLGMNLPLQLKSGIGGWTPGGGIFGADVDCKQHRTSPPADRRGDRWRTGSGHESDISLRSTVGIAFRTCQDDPAYVLDSSYNDGPR